MMRSIPILLAALLCFTHQANAQSDIGKAITVQRDGLSITVGQDGDYSFESDNSAVLRAENENLDLLTKNMIVEMQKIQPTDSARAALEKEQRLWLKERSRHCHGESRRVDRHLREVREQGCLKWAGTARLEVLLRRYDELTEPLETRPQDSRDVEH